MMKASHLLPLLSHLVLSQSPSSSSTPTPTPEFTGQPLRTGICTIQTSTSFVLTPNMTATSAPQPTTFIYQQQGCDASKPDCCPFPLNGTSILSSQLAQCPEDYETLANPYNDTQSSLCCPMGWQVFPTPLPDVELYPCYNTSADITPGSSSPQPSYLAGEPAVAGNGTGDIEEVLYVVLTMSYELLPVVTGVSTKEIVGISVAGGAFGVMLVVFWIMHTHMKKVQRRGRPVRIMTGHQMREWRGDLNGGYKDGGEEANEKGQSKVGIKAVY